MIASMRRISLWSSGDLTGDRKGDCKAKGDRKDPEGDRSDTIAARVCMGAELAWECELATGVHAPACDSAVWGIAALVLVPLRGVVIAPLTA